jgi:WhiB family redox-sensing transcriptional regulator
MERRRSFGVTRDRSTTRTTRTTGASRKDFGPRHPASIHKRTSIHQRMSNSAKEIGPMSDWRHRAACRDEDPELFFPIGNTGPALLQIEDAKAVCRRCDVIDQCLQWALESGQDAGVWGGMSEDERRALKRRAARARSRMA